jgi:hypothetical protein
MSAYRDRAGRASLGLVGLLACLAGLAIAAVGQADGYLIEDGGLRSPAAYDEGYAGESVLVGPTGPGSFESATGQPPTAADMAGEGVMPDGDGNWFPGGSTESGGCTECGGQGCASCADAGCGHGLCGPACPRWAVQVDALMLWQGNIASRPLFINGAGFTALDANQARTPMSAGPRVGLFYFLNQTHAIEGNYFNVRPFDGEATARPGQALTESNLAGFSLPGIDGAQVFTNGAIQSAELNWRRRECWCPVTWLAGFRWVEWNQQMRITEHAGGPVGSFFSETGNDLYGGQAGLDLGLWNGGGPFTVNGIGKAGAFLNNAYQRTSYADSSFASSAAATADRMAFFGELGINGNLRLTNWLSWRMGYVFFWLSGVAVPANQLGTTNLAAVPPTATINTAGSVLLHGATTGLEARW